MSKSLGNSPDPIDLVQKYGTDAVRFTLLYLAPLGQDVRFGEESCEIGRNFANKLWNATRFVIMKRDEYRSTHPNPTFEEPNDESTGLAVAKNKKEARVFASESLADKWILSRANRAAKEIRKSLDDYLIND